MTTPLEISSTASTKNTGQIGIIVVTHVDYGSALLRAAEFILGPLQDCTSIQVDASFEVTEAVARLNEAAERLGTGQGVLVLTDMFGGTPTNLSLSLLKTKNNIEVLTGVNLPMLLRVASNRHLPLQELAELAKTAGCEGIIAAGSILRGKTEGKADKVEAKTDKQEKNAQHESRVDASGAAKAPLDGSAEKHLGKQHKPARK